MLRRYKLDIPRMRNESTLVRSLYNISCRRGLGRKLLAACEQADRDADIRLPDHGRGITAGAARWRPRAPGRCSGTKVRAAGQW